MGKLWELQTQDETRYLGIMGCVWSKSNFFFKCCGTCVNKGQWVDLLCTFLALKGLPECTISPRCLKRHRHSASSHEGGILSFSTYSFSPLALFKNAQGSERLRQAQNPEPFEALPPAIFNTSIGQSPWQPLGLGLMGGKDCMTPPSQTFFHDFLANELERGGTLTLQQNAFQVYDNARLISGFF